MIEKLVQIAAIFCTAFFALLTGNALGHLQYEQVIRFGSAGIVMLVIALIGTFNGCPDESAEKDQTLPRNGP